MSDAKPLQPWQQTVWQIVRLPLEVLLFAAVVLGIWKAAVYLNFPGISALNGAAPGTNGTNALIGFSVFLIGIAFAGFLWWLAFVYYELIRSGKISGENAKDLPLGLPEGTVRAVLALIVGVIGIPLLLFSKTLDISEGIAGMVNGIVTGVFGFYFGTRTTGVPTQAMNQIVQAQGRADEAQRQANVAQRVAAATTDAAAAVTRAGQFNQAVDTVSRNLGLASTLLDVIGPVAPDLLPAGLKDAVTKARTVVQAVQGVTGETATDGQLSSLTSVIGSLVGGDSGGTSGLGSLLLKAAPMLSGVAIPGLGAVAGLGLLVTIGMKLGSAEFQRWRTRVLAAPLASGLIPSGTLTPDEAHGILQDSPKFLQLFPAGVRNTPGFDATLASMVLNDDALEQLWRHFGHDATPALIADKAALEAGLAEFQQKLLAARSANDVSDDLVRTASTTLAQATNTALRPGDPTQLNGAVANQLIDAASQASAASDPAKKDAQAAFDALITVVGNARHNNIDLAQALTEVKS